MSVSTVDLVISRGCTVDEKTLTIRLVSQLLTIDDITNDGDVMYIKRTCKSVTNLDSKFYILFLVQVYQIPQNCR